ncbi:MAG TPA: diguanylate cyclase [Thermoanaerobaculia bacterium]|nr:diguanylate cyclase [Thermoanaerobaculia bacterium]
MLETLPHRRLAAAALTVFVLGLLVFRAVDTADSASRRVGVGLDQDSRGLLITAVEADQPADRAGLAAGDRVLRLGAVATRKTSDWDRAAADFVRGEPVTVEVLRGEQRRTLQLLPGTGFPYGRFAIDAVAVLAYLALALLILVRERRGGMAPRLLFYFSLAVALELALPARTIGNTALVAVALPLYYLLTGFEIGIELHLAALIPDRPAWLRQRPWVVPAFYTVGLGLGGLTTATFLAEDVLGVDPFPWTSGQIEVLLLRLGLPLWALGVTALLVVPTFTHPQPRARQQAGLVLAGVVPWTLFVVTTGALGDDQTAAIGWLELVEPLVLLCYPVAVFVAIFRYHLFDVQVAVRRSLLYGLLTAALLLVFYGVVGAGGAVFQSVAREGASVWALAGAMLLLGLLFAPIMRGLQRTIDRRLFPERHALRAHLVALATELPALGNLPRMGEHLVDRICGIFGSRSAALFLADPAPERLVLLASRRQPRSAEPDYPQLLSLTDPAVTALERLGRPTPSRSPALTAASAAEDSSLLHRLDGLDAELLVPLMNQDRLAGLMVLGPRRSADSYRREEMELLELLARHVALVFENARLFESATFEGLTGLLRREAILENLQTELNRAQRYTRPLTIGLADLDHFKEINDRHGHLAGDSLLKRIAAAIQESLRSSDAVGRYGGEEFLIVLPETPLAGGQIAAEKMRRAVEAVRLTLDDGHEAAVTISVGLASLEQYRDSPVPLTIRDLIAAADRALYQAKNEGRNRVHPLLTRVS